jgi:hypothetical protein
MGGETAHVLHATGAAIAQSGGHHRGGLQMDAWVNGEQDPHRPRCRCAHAAPPPPDAALTCLTSAVFLGSAEGVIWRRADMRSNCYGRAGGAG